MEIARAFLTRLIEPEIDRTVESSHGRNYKSLLQQLVQKNQRGTPLYRLLDECGPDHSKCFKIAAVVGIDAFPPAWGPNKKEAERRRRKTPGVCFKASHLRLLRMMALDDRMVCRVSESGRFRV